MRWLEVALDPARRGLRAAQWRRLQAALALTLSIDAIVVMKDICRLGDDEALDVLRWAATALLRGARSEARVAKRRRARAAAKGAA